MITSSSTEFTGAAVDSGMSVVVTGAYNDSSQAVSALSVTATRVAEDQISITISGVAQTGMVNSQFIIGDIEIIEGDVQPDNLSGNETVHIADKLIRKLTTRNKYLNLSTDNT